MRNSLKTVERLLKEAMPLVTWYFKTFHLHYYNADEDILADAHAYIIKRAQNFKHKDSCSFKSFIRLPLMSYMLNLKPKYDTIAGCHTVEGYNKNKLNIQKLDKWNPMPRLFHQISFDQINRYGGNLYDFVGSTPPEQHNITFFPNLLKEALTKNELEMVNMLFVDGTKYRGKRKYKPAYKTKKWMKRLLRLVKTSELQPKNLDTLCRKNCQNIDRLRRRLMEKVCNYYNKKGIICRLPHSYLKRIDR